MKSSFRLFRIFGIDIGIHYTWLFIFVLFSVLLAQNFGVIHQDWSPLTYWPAGIIGALGIFLSVLLHELAHSLVAKLRNIPVRSITLFILGGVSNLEEEPDKPGVEFAMAIVGPGMSLLLALVFWMIASGSAGRLLDYTGLTSDLYLSSPVFAVIGYLAIANLFLGIFNLLPGFPLDGGRVLRSIIWSGTGNLVRATTIAARVGQFIGWGFILAGVIMAFVVSFFDGLWIAFIGWFLNSSADASRKDITMRERLAHVRVQDVPSDGDHQPQHNGV